MGFRAENVQIDPEKLSKVFQVHFIENQQNSNSFHFDLRKLLGARKCGFNLVSIFSHVFTEVVGLINRSKKISPLISFGKNHFSKTVFLVYLNQVSSKMWKKFLRRWWVKPKSWISKRVSRKYNFKPASSFYDTSKTQNHRPLKNRYF